MRRLGNYHSIFSYIIARYDKIGRLNVRKSPSTTSPAIGYIRGNKDCDGYPHDEYECLGKVNNWYKIRVNGMIGYIRSDMVEWMIHSAWACGEVR